MKQILVLGAGQSTPALISYLLNEAAKHNWFLTVCDKDIAMAQRRVDGHPRGQSIAFDANDSATRVALISKANVVINMLTRPFQHLIALECLNHNAHMISASYEDPRVHQMDADAHRKHLLFLNEMGLDPGIDHMVAMSLLQKIRAKGGIVESFRSYGGGLPAPDEETNPLRYAITWSPRNVVMSGEDGGIYKEDGMIKIVPFHQIFRRTWPVEVDGLGTFEAYPNRNSLSYESTLHLENVHTIIRGTLRYPGWSETWEMVIHLGLANETMKIPDLKNRTYRELTEMTLPQAEDNGQIEQRVARYLGISPTGRIMQNLKWLGLFSEEKISIDVGTAAEVMTDLVRRKLSMPEGARDMIVLVHELVAQYPRKGRAEKTVSTLIEYGSPGSHTAIAKTVGLPMAIAAKLLLTGKIPVTGCHIPTHPAVYEIVLNELREEGLQFKETVEDISGYSSSAL